MLNKSPDTVGSNNKCCREQGKAGELRRTSTLQCEKTQQEFSRTKAFQQQGPNSAFLINKFIEPHLDVCCLGVYATITETKTFFASHNTGKGKNLGSSFKVVFVQRGSGT